MSNTNDCKSCVNKNICVPAQCSFLAGFFPKLGVLVVALAVSLLAGQGTEARYAPPIGGWSGTSPSAELVVQPHARHGDVEAELLAFTQLLLNILREVDELVPYDGSDPVGPAPSAINDALDDTMLVLLAIYDVDLEDPLSAFNAAP